MPLKLIKFDPVDLKPRTIFDCLGIQVDAYVCYTGMETFILCDKKDKGDYRIYSYQGKNDEESLFDVNGKCLLLPEYTLFITHDKEVAVLNFAEAIVKGCLLAEAAAKPKVNSLTFSVALRIWVQEEIRKNKKPDETDGEFVERAILEACKRNKYETS